MRLLAFLLTEECRGLQGTALHSPVPAANNNLATSNKQQYSEDKPYSSSSAANHPFSLYIYIYILLLRSDPIRQQSKVLYRWGFRRRGKKRKHGKRGVK